MSSNQPSSVIPFSSCPQSFPASGSFPVNWLFPSDGQNIGASASASVLPKNIQGWFPLGLTGLTQDLGCTSTPKSSSTIQEGASWRPSEKATSTHWGPQQGKIPNRMLQHLCSTVNKWTFGTSATILMKLFHRTILVRLLKTLIYTKICLVLGINIMSK